MTLRGVEANKGLQHGSNEQHDKTLEALKVNPTSTRGRLDDRSPSASRGPWAAICVAMCQTTRADFPERRSDCVVCHANKKPQAVNGCAATNSSSSIASDPEPKTQNPDGLLRSPSAVLQAPGASLGVVS